MLGFKSEAAAGIALAGIELVRMMQGLQGGFGSTAPLSLGQQFSAPTAYLRLQTSHTPSRNECLQRSLFYCA